MLVLENVRRSFSQGDERILALDGVDFHVSPGERVVIMGPSGSGKSTLLHLAAGLEAPTSGRVLFDGRDLQSLSEGERAQFRRKTVGFVFQFFNLIPTLTALENAALPLDLAGVPMEDARGRAQTLLTQVGLKTRLHHFPSQLSGGEMQRVALARALIAEPRMVLADEPTGNLDSETGGQVLDQLASIVAFGPALVMVTHDPLALRIATRVCDLRDGKLRERACL